jgi:hypothetical protein
VCSRRTGSAPTRPRPARPARRYPCDRTRSTAAPRRSATPRHAAQLQYTERSRMQPESCRRIDDRTKSCAPLSASSALCGRSVWLRKHPHMAATRASKVKAPGSQKRRFALRTGAFGTDSLDGSILRVDGRKRHSSRRTEKSQSVGDLDRIAEVPPVSGPSWWSRLRAAVSVVGGIHVCEHPGKSVAACGRCPAIAHQLTGVHEPGSTSTTGFTSAIGCASAVSPFAFGCS